MWNIRMKTEVDQRETMTCLYPFFGVRGTCMSELGEGDIEKSKL